MRDSLRTSTVVMLTLPAFVVVHACVSVLVFGLGFGVAEADETMALPVGILLMILMPFVALADWMTPPLPDSATLPVGILSSSLFWWFVCLNFIWRQIEASAHRSTDEERDTKP